jgi:hypothetical protein
VSSTRKQRQAQLSFQGLDLAADRRLRQKQLFGSGRKRQAARHRFKGPQGADIERAMGQVTHAIL